MVWISILHEGPTPLSQLRPDVPARLDEMIVKALEKDREVRCQSAAELRADLKRLTRELGARREPDVVSSTARVPGPAPASITSASVEASSDTALAVALARRHRGTLVATFAVLVILAGAVVLWRAGLLPMTASAGGPIDSVVVLPFANASGNPDSEYLSDGITDSLINSLAKLGKIRVVPRGVAFSYKGKMSDLPALAKALNVRAVVTGRVAQRGDTLVVGAELMDVAAVAQTWGDQYTRKMADIFALQDEVTRDIVKNLRVKLSGDDERHLTKKGTANTAAYAAYLQGRFALDKSTPAGYQSAIRSFQESIDRDPQYAAPHAMTAVAYLLLAFSAAMPPAVAYEKARVEGVRAIELDSAAGGAHAVVGALKWLRDWDDIGAEAEFKRGNELEPANDAPPYGLFLSAHDRHDEATTELTRVVSANPTRLPNIQQLAIALLRAGRMDAALEQALKVKDLDAGYAPIYDTLGLIYRRTGRLAEAEAMFRKSSELIPVPNLGMALVYIETGRRREAERVLQQATAFALQGRFSPVSIAAIYAALGDKDQAFVWLDKALAARDTQLLLLDPVGFDSLRGDPRWADLKRRIATAGPPK